jgi:hypothetical protein
MIHHWMKRRIHRSRARCQRALLAHKRMMERDKSKLETLKQIVSMPHDRLVL